MSGPRGPHSSARRSDGDVLAQHPGRSRGALPVAVARQVEGWVRSGRFTQGARLPAERELASRLGTSRNVLREALRILETRGVIQVRHGIGSFVAEGALLGDATIPAQLNLEVSLLPVAELLVARRAIECAVVEVAARARDELDLEELRTVLEAEAAALKAKDKARYVETDLRFHELLGSCTHNSLLFAVQSEVTRATAAFRDVAFETHDAPGTALRSHWDMTDALARGDSEAARAVMVLHLIDTAERTLGALADRAQVRKEAPVP